MFFPRSRWTRTTVFWPITSISATSEDRHRWATFVPDPKSFPAGIFYPETFPRATSFRETAVSTTATPPGRSSSSNLVAAATETEVPGAKFRRQKTGNISNRKRPGKRILKGKSPDRSRSFFQFNPPNIALQRELLWSWIWNLFS